MLDPLKPLIDSWLESDKNSWYKQRHTAKRIFDRLVKEHGFTGNYYMKFLFEQRPNRDMSDEGLEKLAPWNESVKELCSIR